MTKLVDSKLKAVAEEAAEWFLTFTEETEIVEAERRRFIAWLKQSPMHIEEFLQVTALHTDLSDLPITQQHSIDALIQEAHSNVIALNEINSSHVNALMPGQFWNASRSYFLGGIAATIAIFSLTFLWFMYNAPETDQHQSPALVYETGLGEQRSVLLADDSVVELNTQSRLEVKYSDNVRRVLLTAGEAIFDVTKDPNRPFRVQVGLVFVEAIGTRFNVYRQPDQTVVTVVEGVIAVTGAERESAQRKVMGNTQSDLDRDKSIAVQLNERDQIVLAPDGEIKELTIVDLERTTAWTERRLVFDNDLLETVAREVNRYNRRQLVIADPALARQRITGMFNANRPETLITFLEQIGGMYIVDNDDQKKWLVQSAILDTDRTQLAE